MIHQIGPRALTLTASGGGGGGSTPSDWTGLAGVVTDFTGAGYTDINARAGGVTALTTNGAFGSGVGWRVECGQTAGSAVILEDIAAATDTAVAVRVAIRGSEHNANDSAASYCVGLGLIQSQVGDGTWDAAGLSRLGRDWPTSWLFKGGAATVGAAFATQLILANAWARAGYVDLALSRVGTQMTFWVGADGMWIPAYFDTLVTTLAGSIMLRLEQNVAAKTLGADIIAYMPHGVWTPSLTVPPQLALD